METFSLESAIAGAELLLILVVSLIGASIHEYIFRGGRNTIQGFLRSPKIWMSAIVSTIICYAIDPYIMQINPRFVLLPPLLLGLMGMDFVKRLMTLKGVSVLVEWILGFFGITNKNNGGDDPLIVINNGPQVKEDGPTGVFGDDKEILHDKIEVKEEQPQQPQPEEPPIRPAAYDIPSAHIPESQGPPVRPTAYDIPLSNFPNPQQAYNQAPEAGPVLSTSNFEKLMNLDQMVHSVMDSICNLIVAYYIMKNAEDFLRGYFTIKTNISIMQSTIKEYQLVPISTAIKLSEILKKEVELDRVYEEVMEKLKDSPAQGATVKTAE